MIKAFINFLLLSKNEHSIHSPFIFELYTKIIQNKGKLSEYTEIEKYRKEQLKNNKTIAIEDFGAGSKHNRSKTRKISEIAKNAEKNPKFGQLLFRLVNFFEPKVVFDLGTSLGITTLYESKALKNNGKIYTFEGCPQTAAEAEVLFQKARAENIEITVGNLDITLPQKLKEIDTLDFVFFDANHRFEPTIRYFESCLTKANDSSVFVFDDIHWSPEMELAWEKIKSHQKVLLTVDLFYVGLVFFRTNQPKQHFLLRF